MEVELTALQDGKLPERYSVDGRAFSPALNWEAVPEGTRSLALVLETVDGDGARKFVHWLAWQLDPDWGGLDEGLMSQPEPSAPDGMRQGTADTGKTGYAAPVGTLDRPQHMKLRLFALDAPLDLEPAADKAAFDKAIEGHVVAEAEQSFDYVRSG